ncbi:ECF-type sigma factor [Pelomonas cellulosilytica]|uniref:Sigma-70 family RNA polymerase sigma factor n=1 Tax=Pelomonas cellulosilytica TaxID=2906762 RepID=A0ABS8XQV7_9BURK|nr:ECF-type sigma factor [Pelomonas sp. P8]MCE4554047.1 sigma-70 family RNA polymerase sigma factor [Pelomonas sp. P8]
MTGMPRPELLPAAGGGDASAVDELFGQLYAELRRAAHARLYRSTRDGAALLDTTALVHETYERLARQASLSFANQTHFLAYASRAMRSVLVDAVRERLAEQRGGAAVHVELTTGLGERLSTPDTPELLRVHEALSELAAIEPRLAQVVEMRYFGGLTNDEIAAALGIGLRTVERDWERARSFLYAALQ